MVLSVEDRLCAQFGYTHVVLTGWARAAIVALLDSLAHGKNAPFIFPANTCPAVLAAIVAAGSRPIPVTVSATSGLATDDALAAAMEQSPGPGVVMPTHLYGSRAAYPKTQAVARARGWFVLENDTMAATAMPGEKPCGFGDALLVSFGRDKTIDAGGGGALFSNDPTLIAAAQQRVAAWPPFDQHAADIETHLALARRHLRALGRPFVSEAFVDIDTTNVRYSLPEQQRTAILSAMEATPGAIQRRLERRALWDAALADLAGDLLVPTPSPVVPWRVIRYLRQPELRAPFVDTVRAHGFDVGVNFPPLTETYPMLLGGDAGNDPWGHSVVNFWLTENYDKARISAAIDVMKIFFAEHRRKSA